MSFLPRQVAQSLKSRQLTPSRSITTQARAVPTVALDNEARIDATDKSQTGYYSYEDIEILVRLATSDHALWSNPDLRYLLEDSSTSEGGEKCEFSGGCVRPSVS
jgi:hypothetical protein